MTRSNLTDQEALELLYVIQTAWGTVARKAPRMEVRDRADNIATRMAQYLAKEPVNDTPVGRHATGVFVSRYPG